MPNSIGPSASASATNLPALRWSLLLSQPATFFVALAQHPRDNGRYLGLLLLAGIFKGASNYAASRPLEQALANLPEPYNVQSSLLSDTFLGLLSLLLLWLLLWGLTALVLKTQAPKHRAPEVYGAALLGYAMVTSLLSLLLFLVPANIGISPPELAGLSDQQAQLAVVRYQLQVFQQSLGGLRGILELLRTLICDIWLFYLAYVGFCQTLNPTKLANSGTDSLDKVSSIKRLALRAVIVPVGISLAFYLITGFSLIFVKL